MLGSGVCYLRADTKEQTNIFRNTHTRSIRTGPQLCFSFFVALHFFYLQTQFLFTIKFKRKQSVAIFSNHSLILHTSKCLWIIKWAKKRIKSFIHIRQNKSFIDVLIFLSNMLIALKRSTNVCHLLKVKVHT